MDALKMSCWVLGAYLVGSVPFGLLMGKVFFGIDIREHGSRNLGATNAARVLGHGRRPATVLFFSIVTLLDAAKGFFPVFLAEGLLPPAGFQDGLFLGLRAGLFTASAAIAGHMASVYLGFRGGKGVAASAGAIGALAPVPLALTAGLWLLTVAATRYISLGSLVSAVALPVAVGVLSRDPAMTVFFGLLGAVVVFKHRNNVRRLLEGTENKVGGREGPEGRAHEPLEGGP